MDRDYIPVLKLTAVLLSVVITVLLVLLGITYFQRFKSPSKSPSQATAQPTPTSPQRHLTSQESGFFLSSSVLLETPVEMVKLDCAKYWHFYPKAGKDLSCQNGQDPTKIPITVYADAPLTFQTSSQGKNSTNLRQNLKYGSKAAQDFTSSFTQNGTEHPYKMTAIQYSQDKYLYIVLTDPEYEAQYSQLLSSLKFK